MTFPYLLWDHDGVLVDTERWYFEATRSVLARLDIELSQARYLDLMAAGESCWDLARAEGLAGPELEARRNQRDALYQEFLRHQPIEIEGVAEVLDQLAGRHRMGVVTTARRADFDLIHAERRLLDHFEFALTVEDYERAKPHPAPYLAGLARFGARPQESVALEDSARGLRSARAAGLRCLVIHSAFTASQDFEGAWARVDSIRDVPRALAAASVR
ncbi:MAG: HAD family phosphatase [Proteobacteria bacterium]|nr:HAD family phosphatase [Pseudomonadota bacterium]